MKNDPSLASSTAAVCPHCGAELPPASPQGLCPRCLVAAALSDPVATEAPAAPTEQDAAWLAEHFPHLVIEEVLGIGGMGRVYKARQPHLNRTVALKVLAPARANDPEWLERFTREARALARLSHPHIVQVYDFGDAPVPYLLMEYVDGVNLRQAMANGALTAREALAIVPKLCDALHYAHERGVLHRDIKPENVLIDSEGRVKLVDFGLAKLREDDDLSFTLTQSGAKLGTLAYMAPEQVEHPHEVDHRADIYSLGVVFYEMLTGELPLGRFPAPSEASGVDPRLDGVVMRTLEKSRERRFQTANDFRSGLQSAAEGPAAVPPAGVGTSPRQINFDYRTSHALLGLPLLHIAMGTDPATGRPRQARGIVAIGTRATGVVAIGVIARGILCSGVLSFGLLSFGVCSVGLLFAYGVFCLGSYAVGNNVLGYVAAGVRAEGIHAASLTGAVDPRAADFGDFWLASGTAPFLSVIAFTLLTLMSVTAWATWMQYRQLGRRRAGLRHAMVYLLIGLVGPLAFLSVPDVWTRRPQFRNRLETQARQSHQMPPTPPPAKEGKAMGSVSSVAEPLITRVSRTDSPAERQAAIRDMITAIRSTDPTQILGGLSAAIGVEKVHFDRTELRQAARPHLDSANSTIRARAVLAVMCANPETSDHERILKMVPDATQQEWGALALAIANISERDYTGLYAKPMLHLLDKGIAAASRGAYDARQVLGPLWGGRFSPELEAKVVEWSYLQPGPSGVINAGGVGYDTFYHALSTQANKSALSVKRLLELADHPDTTNIAGRCLWGLRGTVPNPADQATVADYVARLLEQRMDDYLWKQGLALLTDYASREHLPALEKLAQREALPTEHRDQLQQIVARIIAKP